MILEFAAKRRVRKTKTCKKGYNCGNACIQKERKCRRKFSDQASTYAGWLKKQAQKAGTEEKRTTQSTPKKPKSDKKQSSKSKAIAKEYKEVWESQNIEKLTEIFEKYRVGDVVEEDYNPSQDNELKAMLKELEYNKLPTVLNKAQIDKEAIKPGAIATLRGVQGDTQEDSKQFSDDFKNGDYFVGKGVYGSGTYMAYKKDEWAVTEDTEGMDTAKQYAGIKGGIIKSVIPKNYKLATQEQYSSINNARVELDKKFGDELTKLSKSNADLEKRKKIFEAKNFWQNQGVVMSILGYDGYIADKDRGFLVALNRGKLLVQKENVKFNL